MVFFSCSGCNESLKKNKVANHLSFCRRCQFLTCLDCQKDFDSDSYLRHNQCVTEVERYGGPGYVLPENANKGQKKQMGWMDSVRMNIDTFLDETKNVKHKKDEQILMTGLQRYDNIPRKKAKFVNFIKSSFARYRYNAPLIESAWNVISVIKSEEEDKAIPDREEAAQKEQLETHDQEVKDETKRRKKKVRNEVKEEDAIDSSKVNGDSGDMKKRKKRKKHEEVSESMVEEQDVEEEESESKKKKKKKKSKRKMEGEEDEAAERLVVEQEVEEEESESIRRKKKKKRKIDTEEDEETEVRKKKKKKRGVKVDEEMDDLGNSNIESEVLEGEALEGDECEMTPTGDLSPENESRNGDDKENEVEVSMNEGAVDSDEMEDTTSRKKKKKKKKKRKRKESDLEDNTEEAEDVTPPKKRPKKEYVPEGFQQQRLNETLELKTPKKFSISNAINSILEKNGEEGISMKKLEKKVLSEYQVSLKEGQPFRPHKICSKLKIVVSKHFRLVNDRVFLRPEF